MGFPAVVGCHWLSVLFDDSWLSLSAPILAELKETISFLAMVTPVLAYAAMANHEMDSSICLSVQASKSQHFFLS